MTEQNKRLKKGFRILPHTDELIESHKHTTYSGERSAFVDEAVKYYCAVLDGESSKNVLSEEVIRIVKAAMRDSENHISSTMFKVAGELALQSYLIGEMGLDLSDDEIRRYRNAAYDRVRKQHGLLRLEEALTYDN